MPLRNYGLLTGRVTRHGAQQGGNPHYLLLVETGPIAFRVAINLGLPGEGMQFQVVDKLEAVAGAKKLLAAVRDQGPDGAFTLAADGAARLDFVHDGWLDTTKFTTGAEGDYARALADLAEASQQGDGFVAVFGTGFPDQDDRPPAARTSLRHTDPRRASFGFDAIDNVHMNQGSHHLVGRHLDRHYMENGPAQDGALLFFAGRHATGLFAKYASQDTTTDRFGNPVSTGVPALDAHARKLPKHHPLHPAVRARRLARLAPNGAADSTPADAVDTPPTAPTRDTTAAPASGFVFADAIPVADPTRPFAEDNDGDTYKSPFVLQFARYGVAEPVPAPREGTYPVLKLEAVLGADAVAAIAAAGRVVFHAVGDTGAPKAEKLPNEVAVADLMAGDIANAPDGAKPAFFFHLGDVVYYYGEQAYYYDQFYKPYKDYAAPIFAVPGNHDGITYTQDMVSLEAFIAAFCDTAPQHWQGAAGIARTTMIQPGVYFTLDAPLVSIIGLYSNCSEYYGALDDAQRLFFHSELTRLKPLRESGQIQAIVVAVHHPPLSFSPRKPSSAKLRDDLDAACKDVGLWPDAYLSGHAHLYQRITRLMDDGTQIPYIVCGAGGYDANAKSEIDKQDFAQQDVSDPQFRLHRLLANYGFLRITVSAAAGTTPPLLRFEYFSPDVNAGQAADVAVLDLSKKLLL